MWEKEMYLSRGEIFAMNCTICITAASVRVFLRRLLLSLIIYIQECQRKRTMKVSWNAEIVLTQCSIYCACVISLCFARQYK